MATMVHVIYTGIVSFVQLPSGVAWMMMPNAEGHSPPHKAYVVVEDAAATVTGLTAIDSEGGMTAYAVKGYEIDFGRNAGTQTTVEAACILPLSKGCPGTAAQCGAPHSGYYSGSDPKVATRSRISEGTLQAAYVEEQWDWEFKKPADPAVHVGHLAQEVCHSFEVAGTELEVIFRGGGAPERILLESQAGQPIELRIGNTPKDDIFLPSAPAATPMDDEHVKLYYDLSNEVVTWNERPLLAPLANSPNDDCAGAGHAHRLGGLSMAQSILASREGGQARRSSAGQHTTGVVGILSVGGMNCPPALWK